MIATHAKAIIIVTTFKTVRVFHVLSESQTQPETAQFQLLRLALPVQSEPEGL